MALVAWQIALGVLLWGSLANAQSFDVSETDSRQFQFFKPIDKMYLRPGNDGMILLKEPAGQPDSGLRDWQDEYCNSRCIVLDSPDYEIRPGNAATGAAYWKRMDHYTGQMTMTGSQAFWVIDQTFLKAINARPELQTELMEHLQTYRQRGLFSPALVFRIGSASAAAVDLYQQLIEAGHVAGAHFTATNWNGSADYRWGFIVVDEENLPLAHGGASAAGWAHATFGQVPVIISPRRPDFLRDTKWLTTGMAGVAFRPLEDDFATTDAVQIRADSTFLNRFASPLVLKPRASAPGIILELASDNPDQPATAWVLDEFSSAVELPLAGFSAAPGLAATWFRPDTDENILLPQTAPMQAQTIKAPGPGQWIYSVQASSRPVDQLTTITAIRDWTD